MDLSEAKAGLDIKIIAGIGSQVLEFDTKLTDVAENNVYTEAIYREGKLLGFGSEGLILKIQITNPEDQKVYEWGNVRILNIKTAEGRVLHKVICRQQTGKQINRRSGCRVWLGLNGTLESSKIKSPHDVVIKDISLNGIGFVCESALDVEIGDDVHLTFNDEGMQSKFQINATVVRKEEAEKENVICGCKFKNDSNAIAKYVNEKQRKQLKASRTVNALRH